MHEVLEFLDKYSSIAIFTHMNPDGDALGSAFSLAEALRSQGKAALAVLLEEPPQKYYFDEFKELYTKDYKSYDMDEFDACVAVDCADTQRLSKLKDSFFAKPTLNIDHHISNNNYAMVNYVNDAPSTGEIIYDIFKQTGTTINDTAAMALYMAISTDTGNFTYSNTTPKTLKICSELVNGGLNISRIAGKIFNERSMEATKLICKFIENMRMHYGSRLATSVIMQSDLQELGAKSEDCENLVNYARNIDTVEIAAFIKEVSKDTYKISLRSKAYANVSEFAERFGGGGHVRAAGYLAKGNIHNVMQSIVTTAKDFLT